MRRDLFQRPPRQDLRQMPAVIRRAVQILLRVGAVRGPLGRLAKLVVVPGLAAQRLLDAGCPDGAGPHPGKTNRYLCDLVTAYSRLRSDRDNRPVLRPAAELQIGAFAARRWRRDPDLAQHLVGSE